MSPIANVAALIAAICILQLGQGLLGVALPLGIVADGHSQAAVGLIASAYSIGFMVSAWYAPRLLAGVGHIRVFTAAAAVASAATLALHWAGPLLVWALARAAVGAGVALMFASAESWMNGAMDRSRRGDIMGVYMVSAKIVLATGPFLTFGAPPGAPDPIILGAALFALAILPIAFTSTAQPAPPKAQPLALGPLFRTAPAAVIACFGAGVMNAGVLAVVPTYAESHFGPGAAAGFMAAGILGSLVVQWPAARVSDRIDRRLVIAALIGSSTVAAVALALVGERLAERHAGFLFALWGAGALSFYGIAVAHMTDRAERGALAQASAGLLFVWAAGSIIGPALIGLVTDVFGGRGLWLFAACAGAVLTGAMLWRRRQREPAAIQAPVQSHPGFATSIAAAELSYGEELQEELPLNDRGRRR